MVEIRAMGHSDLPTVACIHQKAFEGFLMTLLGRPFLQTYYAMVVDDPAGLGLVAQERDALTGFLAAYVDPLGFYARLRSRKLRLAASALIGVLLRPKDWWTIAMARHSYGGSRATYDLVVDQLGTRRVVELASVAVPPVYHGRGIGSRLVKHLIETTATRADAIYLTTDAVNNESVKAFYNRLGFRELTQVEKTPGRKMSVFVYTFPGVSL